MRSGINDYKYLGQMVYWNVIIAVVCIPTAGKLVDILGAPLSITIFYFPFVYVLSDVTTEVYGYAAARRVLWLTILAQVLATAIFQFVLVYPPSVVMRNNRSYVDVLSMAPRLVVFGNIAVFAGNITNNYVLAKLKLWTDGKHLPVRFVFSTLCGQVVNSVIFYVGALAGSIPTGVLAKTITIESLISVGIEIAVLPISMRLSFWLKKAENVDFFDRATNFSPLKF